MCEGPPPLANKFIDLHRRILGARIKSTPELCQVATDDSIEGVRRYSLNLSYVMDNHMSTVFVISVLFLETSAVFP
jgi:hypothetical protein